MLLLSLFITVAICLSKSSCLVCPIREKVADKSDFLITGCPLLGIYTDRYDIQRCAQKAISEGGNAINYKHDDATCYIKQCDLTLDSPEDSSGIRDVYAKQDDGTFNRISAVPDGKAFICADILTNFDADTPEECATSAVTHGGNAFNMQPATDCFIKNCVDGNMQLEALPLTGHDAFSIHCSEIREVVSLHGKEPFEEGIILDEAETTFLDSSTSTDDQTLTFSLPLLADTITVLIVGEDLQCQAGTYYVYIPTTTSTLFEKCEPMATNLA